MPKTSRSEFEKTLTFENDGLTQHSIRTITHVGDLHGPTRVDVKLHLPPYFFKHYWKEYDLSETDVHKISSYLPAQLYWLACLVHGTDIIASCLKPSFAKIDEVFITYRSTALRTLISHQKHVFRNKQQVLDTASIASMQHIPPLPTKEIHESLISKITKLLYPKLKSFQICKVPGLFELDNKLFLPVKLEGDAIYLQRATRYKNYEASKKRQRYGLASMCFVVQVPTGELYALTEEGLLVTAKQ